MTTAKRNHDMKRILLYNPAAMLCEQGSSLSLLMVLRLAEDILTDRYNNLVFTPPMFRVNIRKLTFSEIQMTGLLVENLWKVKWKT